MKQEPLIYFILALHNVMYLLNPKFQDSSYSLSLTRPVWVLPAEEAGLSLSWSQTPEDRFSQIFISRPPSGSMLLYNRNKVRHRKDNYCWKKRKDGKTIREDHMKLKVQGLEVSVTNPD